MSPERVYTTPLLDKLGVKPGSRVALIDVEDDAFRGELSTRTDDLTDGSATPDSDLIFLGADTVDQLLRVGALRSRIKQNGAIWVVSRKGKEATLRDVDVIEAAKSVGLVDNKVVSFSPTHTALRLVIPRELRGRAARRG